MTIDPNNSKHLIADEGKVLRCKYCNVVMGNQVWMGDHTHEGQTVEETVDDYEEIDGPERPNYEELVEESSE